MMQIAQPLPANVVPRRLSEIEDARERHLAGVAVRELEGCLPDAETRVVTAWLSGQGELVRLLAEALDAERRRHPRTRLSSRVVITRAPKGVRVDVEDVPAASEQDY